MRANRIISEDDLTAMLNKQKRVRGVERKTPADVERSASTPSELRGNGTHAETTTRGLQNGPSPYAPYKNKLEYTFAQTLVVEKHAGLIKDWTYESMTLKLSNAAPGKRGDYHRSDFLIWHNDGSIELAQTKGWHKNISASLKGLRWAAQKNPWFKFTIRRHQNGWHSEAVEA